jgi:hypothetical protein
MLLVMRVSPLVVKTSELITITAASSYQPTVIVHHHSRFAPPTGGDDVLIITAISPYEPTVKTFFTASLLYDTAVITML